MSCLATTSQRAPCAVFTKEQIVVVLDDTADAAAGNISKSLNLSDPLLCGISPAMHQCLGAHTAIKGMQQQGQKWTAKAAMSAQSTYRTLGSY